MTGVSITPFGGRGNHKALVVKRAGDVRPLFLDSGNGRVLIEDWRSLPGSPELHWAKPTLAVCDGGTQRLVVSDKSDAPVAEAELHHLGDGGAAFQVMFGSCYSARSRGVVDVTDFYRRVRAEAGQPPAVNLWLGDQVYVDAPWQKGWSANKPSDVAASKYAEAWGITTDADAGLSGCMSKAANWYIPDDHEFWNGYPKPSLFTLPVQTALRLAQQGYRFMKSSPPHPAAQWKWGSAMGEAFCVFQTDLEFDTFDVSTSPPQTQTFDVGDVQFLLLDQRWHRTIRRGLPGAGFMAEADLRRAIETIGAHDGLLCLGLARPMIGHMPTSSLGRKAEYGAEDYRSQYLELWKALRRRAGANRPTIILAGDVHGFSTRTAIDRKILELTASPLSLLDALDDDTVLARLREAWSRLGEARRRLMSTFAEGSEATGLSFPVVADDSTWKVGIGREWTPAHQPTSGISGLTIDWNEMAQTVTLHTASTQFPGGTEPVSFTWSDSKWTER